MNGKEIPKELINSIFPPDYVDISDASEEKKLKRAH